MGVNIVEREHKLENPQVQAAEFDILSGRQVANLYALRYNVFVKEQQSIYDEHDGHDFDATHIFIENEGKIIAYARVYRKDENTASIGRVAVEKEYRGQELGRKIVSRTIEAARNMGKVSRIDIGAQQYLQKFYVSFGFKVTSEPYDGEGVMHVDMSLLL